MTAVERPPLRFWEFLDRGLLHDLGIPALVASLVLFVCAMTLLGANISEMRTGYARVQRSNTALLQLAIINTDILRVEMIVRGYALSGDPVYLTWQKMATDAEHGRMASFDTLFVDNPAQKANVVTLKALLKTHDAYFGGLARRVTTDQAAVTAEIVAYGKKATRRSIENLLVVMRNDQMRHLAEQQHEAETRVVGAYRYAIGISILALLLGAFGFAIIIHDRRADRRSPR